MELQSVRVILHGKVASRDDVRAAVRALRDKGHQIEVCVTWEAGDASRFARQAVDIGIKLVVAGGGDGTINQVVSGLIGAATKLEQGPALGILPLGTANDLARSCKIPLDPLPALELAFSGIGTNVDVGQANGNSFVNVATGGFGTQVTVATPNDLKRLLGGAAYFLTGLTHFSSIRPSHCEVSGPGLHWDGDLLVLGIGNGRQAGGGHQLCPSAILNDGLLDLLILPRLPPEELKAALTAMMHEGLSAAHNKLITARVPWLDIDADEPIQINLDGEPITDTRFHIEVLPQRLALKLPPDCPLVG